MCDSLLLPRISPVVALGRFGCGGKLRPLLLGYVHAPVADLLGTEPFVRLQHRLGRCLVLETQTLGSSSAQGPCNQRVMMPTWFSVNQLLFCMQVGLDWLYLVIMFIAQLKTVFSPLTDLFLTCTVTSGKVKKSNDSKSQTYSSFGNKMGDSPFLTGEESG